MGINTGCNTVKIEKAVGGTYWLNAYRVNADGKRVHTPVFIDSKDADAMRLFLNSYHDYGDHITLGVI